MCCWRGWRKEASGRRGEWRRGIRQKRASSDFQFRVSTENIVYISVDRLELDVLRSLRCECFGTFVVFFELLYLLFLSSRIPYVGARRERALVGVTNLPSVESAFERWNYVRKLLELIDFYKIKISFFSFLVSYCEASIFNSTLNSPSPLALSHTTLWERYWVIVDGSFQGSNLKMVPVLVRRTLGTQYHCAVE